MSSGKEKTLRRDRTHRIARWLFIPITVVLLSMTGCSLFANEPSNKVDDFFMAVKSEDYKEALHLFAPVLRDKMSEMVSGFTTGASEWASSTYEVKNSAITGDKAVVTIEIVERKPEGTGGESVDFGSRQELSFYLVKIDGNWYIEAISQ